MTSKEYEKLESRFQELYKEKGLLEIKLEKVSAEYAYIMNRLNNEPIED